MPTSIPIKNTNQANQIKISKETSTTIEHEIKDIKTNKTSKVKETTWNPGVVTYLKPGEQTDIWVGESVRYIVTEMPT